MKKLIGTLVAALLAAAVFADVGVGAWGRGWWVPFAYDGDPEMGIAASWGGSPRVGVSLGGASENVGFAMDLKGDGGNIAINDNAFIWVKPWSWLKITVGQAFDETLRGSCYFGSWDGLRPGNALGDDLTFARIDGRTQGKSYTTLQGAILAIDPIEGLHIAAGFNIGYNTRNFVDVLKYSQYQAGYTIDGIMAIKAQYYGMSVAAMSGVWGTPVYKQTFDPATGETKVELDKTDAGYNTTWGEWANDEVYYGIINAAVDILAIEGNKISVGAYIPTDKKRAPLQIAATYNGSFDAASLAAFVQANLPYTTAEPKDIPFGLNVGIGFGYDLGDGMSISADVRANMEFGDDFAGDIAVGAWFNKGLANGSVGIGVIAEFGVNKDVAISNMAENKFGIAIPIKLEYAF